MMTAAEESKISSEARMKIRNRFFVLGALLTTSAFTRLSAAESSPLPVPVTWIGGAPAQVIHIERLDASNRVMGSVDVAPVGSSVEVRRSNADVKFRFSADGFVPADLSADRLGFGVVLRAFGTIVVERSSATPGALPPTVTVHILEDRLAPRGVIRQLHPIRRDEVSFPAPPGTWNVLVDDGVHPPTVAERLWLEAGERRKITLSSPHAGSTEIFLVTDAEKRPLPGAELRWSSTPPSPASELLERWTASRQLRTGRDGRIRIDRLPSIPHSWAIRASGYRTRIIEVRPRDRDPVSRSHTVANVALRPLPALRVRMKGLPDGSPAARLTIRRLPGRGETGPPGHPPVWTGEIRSEVVVPGLEAGLYRAEAVLEGLVAAA